MSKMKRDNPQYSYFHTKTRMEERYDYKGLTVSEYKNMCTCCSNGVKINTEVTTKGEQYTYQMIFNGMEIIAVYQTWKQQISTVLPKIIFKKENSNV